MRTQHCTTASHATIPRRVTHKIRNWSNFQTPGVSFRTSKPQVLGAQGTPPDWVGQFDFSFSSLEAPLQVFARDATDVGNRAMVGMRRSDRPSAWLNMKALDVEASDVVVTNNGRTITYPGLWPGCDLVYEVGGHKLKETVVVWDKSVAPSKFEWTLKYSPSHTIDIAGDVLTLYDGDGEKQIETRRPWGEDSATTAPTATGHQYIRCALTEENPHQGLVVVCLTPNPDDMATSVGVVRLDPTTVISGIAAIDDASISSGSPSANYGGWVNMRGGRTDTGSTTWRTLTKIATAAIPAEDLTGFRVKVYRGSHPNSTASGVIDLFRIFPANVWTEGTTSGSAPEVGAVCWGKLVYNTVNWAGSVGCTTSGVDYAADASPPSIAYDSYTSGPDVLISITLDPAWPTGWRDSTFANNGMIWKERNAWSADDALQMRATETLTGNEPTFEIDVGSLEAKYFFIGF